MIIYQSSASIPNSGCVVQVKTNEEPEGNKTKRSTYLKRTVVNCSYSKILVIVK